MRAPFLGYAGLLLMGIVADVNQSKSVGHPLSLIEMKQRGSGATTRGNAFDPTTIEAKMAIPSLLTRIEEKDDFL